MSSYLSCIYRQVNLSIDRFYEAMDHGVSYEEAVNRATTTVMDALENTPSADVAKLTDYDTMKDKLVMEVVSAETNADMLQNIPHKNMEDMAVVYRFVLDSDENGRASILVTNGMLETMGVTPEQLHADAMENSPELKPAVIKGMSEVVAEMMGMSKEDMAIMGHADYSTTMDIYAECSMEKQQEVFSDLSGKIMIK